MTNLPNLKNVRCKQCGKLVGCPTCGQPLSGVQIVVEDRNVFCCSTCRDKNRGVEY